MISSTDVDWDRRISSFIHRFKWDVITRLYQNFNGGLNKPPLTTVEVRHWWLITFYCSGWIYLLIHAIFPMLIYLILTLFIKGTITAYSAALLYSLFYFIKQSNDGFTFQVIFGDMSPSCHCRGISGGKDVSNHWQLGYSYFPYVVPVSKQENNHTPHYYNLLRYYPPVDPPSKGPTIGKVFLCHNIILEYNVKTHSRLTRFSQSYLGRYVSVLNESYALMHFQSINIVTQISIMLFIHLWIGITLSVREITKSSSTFSARNISSNMIWFFSTAW